MSNNAGTGNLGVIITASLAGLLFGFDTVVMPGVTQSLREMFYLEPGSWWFGFSVASALFGTALGAFFAGIPGDRFGSRDSLEVVGLLYVISALGSALCWSLLAFYVFRFIGGLAIGASSLLAPVYIAEIAPRSGPVRSRVCSSSTSCSASCWPSSATSCCRPWRAVPMCGA